MEDKKTINKKFENSIDKDKKKNNGIYYTDIFMVKQIIKEIKIEGKDNIVVDPCCGIGNFIEVLQQSGYINSFGLDIDKTAIEYGKTINNLQNLFVMDTISNDKKKILEKIDRKCVDYVVGNPPYVPMNNVSCIKDNKIISQIKDNGNNLYIGALIRAIELVKEDGKIAYIIPKNFLHIESYTKMRKKILDEFQIESIVDIGAYFKNVRGEQIVIILKKTKASNSHKIKIKKMDKTSKFKKIIEVNQNYYTDQIILFNNKIEKNIYDKFKSTYNTLEDLCQGYVGRGKSKKEGAISGKDIRKFCYKNGSVPEKGNQIFIQNIYSAEAGVIGAFGGSLEATETVTIITDGEEDKCRYILGFLHSRLCNYYLYRYCYNNSKLTMHTDAKYIRKIPMVIKYDDRYRQIVEYTKKIETVEYMTKEWFNVINKINEIIYTIYGLSDDDIKYIDEQTREIQSNKWGL